MNIDPTSSDNHQTEQQTTSTSDGDSANKIQGVAVSGSKLSCVLNALRCHKDEADAHVAQLMTERFVLIDKIEVELLICCLSVFVLLNLSKIFLKPIKLKL